MNKYPNGADKLEARREQSISSHINRIRFANEKRITECDRSYNGLPQISNNGSYNITPKKRTHHKKIWNKNELNEPQFGSDNGNNRFLTAHVKNPSYTYSENSGDMGHGAEEATHPQGGIHEISTSHESTENQDYIFTDNSVDSTDKLEVRREQSISNHINRIRFANGQPKISNNGSSNITSQKRTRHKNVSNKNELNEPRFGDDNGNNRFLTPHGNNPSCRYSKNSEDTGHGAEDTTNPQGGIHEIPTSNKSNGARSKKSRKQWAKTTKTVSELDMTGQENTAERNGGHGFTEKNLSEKNTRESNGIQNETNVEPPEYVENNMTAKLPATERIANVADGMESLPPPESGEPTLEPIPNGISEERSDFLQSLGKGVIIKQDDIAQDSASVGEDQQGTKNSKKTPRKDTKQIESLPSPESGEFNLEPVSCGIPKERSDLHQSSWEDIIIKEGDSTQDSARVGGDPKEEKKSKLKSTRKVTKLRRNVSGLSKKLIRKFA